ncbi:RING finger protein 145-like isoform X4 [Melanerpes formicivorus]|uniref:RING finger protein 145-like isoform X4 n=1 Tax=Melanerpes formicivorus TaxID=211600 RepID=UPI00358EAE47
MARLEAVANVALRVPGLALLDLLYRWDAAAIGELLRPRRGDPPFLRAPALRAACGLGHILCLVVLVLPVQSLVKLYLHLLTALLLALGHTAARDYIRRELEFGDQGAVYHDPAALSRLATTLAGQLCLCALCSLLMRSRQPWLFGAPALPALARLCGLPLRALPLLDAFATTLTTLQVLYVLASHVLVPFQLAAAACRQIAQALELSRLVALGVSLWSQLAVPLLFLVFWLALFTLRLSAFLTSSSSPLAQQGLLFLLLSSIILFIVVTSTLQSMIEIADPIVLALGASRSRSPWKHFRGVSLCLFLLVFPCFMAYKIAHFFQLDFWLLILVSSCMLTSLQVMGTLFIYSLFMVELLQERPLERMDEIIYWVNAVSRVLEFLVALCVVAYGTWESLLGEWSWMGASVIIIHSYFNVWLRAQSGWRSFLLRREAAKKINSLPRATGGQLRDHNDVCAICFQDMQVAVVTPCSHFFHAACLRKWLYVQDTCPLCHQPVAAVPSGASGLGAVPALNHGQEVPGGSGAGGSPAPARHSDGAGDPEDGAGGWGRCRPGAQHPPQPPAGPRLGARDDEDCQPGQRPS